MNTIPMMNNMSFLNHFKPVKMLVLSFVIYLSMSSGLTFANQDVNPPKNNAFNQVLTLNAAKQIALENSPGIASAMERIKQAKEAVVQAEAAYLPTISATAGWDYTEDTDDGQNGIASDSDDTQYNGRISATQVLFDGFYRKYAALSARYGEEMSNAARDESQRLLGWSVAQTYLNIQLARENMTIARSDMEFNRKQEREAVAKEKVGTGSYSDVLNFRTKVNTAKSTLLSAKQDFAEAVFGLAALMGAEEGRLPDGMTIAPLDLGTSEEYQKDDDRPLDPVDPVVGRIDESLIDQRPDIRHATLSVENSEAEVHMAKADYLPTISLTGSYGSSSGDTLLDTDDMGATLGLNVTFDLFSGGTRQSKVRKALSDKRELENDLKEAKITALSNIRSAAQNIVTTRQQLTLQEENTTLMKTTRDLVEKEYNAGLASLVRLNEAQNNLVSAMGELAIAKVSLELAMESYAYYTGSNYNL